MIQINIVKLLEELKLNSLIKAEPIRFILFNEFYLEEITTLDIYKYRFLLTKEVLEEYFDKDIKVTDLVKYNDVEKLDPIYKEFLQVICERLENIKSVEFPKMTDYRKTILKAILNSNNIFISLPNREKTIHKYELITFLSLIEWESYAISNTFGWDSHYTSIEFEFDHIFNIGKLEVHLSQSEMKSLYESLPKLKYEETSKGISEISDIYSERNKEIIASLSL